MNALNQICDSYLVDQLHRRRENPLGDRVATSSGLRRSTYRTPAIISRMLAILRRPDTAIPVVTGARGTGGIS